MDIGNTSPLSSEREPILANCISTSPHTNLDESFLNISIKDEPLTMMDCLLNDMDIKSEPEDIDVLTPIEPKVSEGESDANIPEKIETKNIIEENDTKNFLEIPAHTLNTICNEPKVSEGESDANILEKIETKNIIEENDTKNSLEIPAHTLNTICNGREPVTKTLVINGQQKTCILVNNPQLKQSIMESLQQTQKIGNHQSLGKNTAYPKKDIHPYTHQLVKCSRCGTEVLIDNFREHIDACPPRTSKIIRSRNGKKVPTSDQNETVHAMYNPVTGKVITLNDNKTKASFQTLITKDIQEQSCNFRRSKKLQSNSSNNSLNEISPERKSLSSSSNNASFESAKINYERLQSNTDNVGNTIYDNSQILLRALLNNLPKNDDSPRTLSLQTRPKNLRSLLKPRSQNTFNSKNIYTDSLIKSIQKLSDDVSQNNAALCCYICNFSSPSLILMAIHLEEHEDRISLNNVSVPTTLNNKYLPNSKNKDTVSNMSIESDKSSREATSAVKVMAVSKDGVQVEEDALTVFQSESDSADTDKIISGKVIKNNAGNSLEQEHMPPLQNMNKETPFENLENYGPQTPLEITKCELNPPKQTDAVNQDTLDGETEADIKELVVSTCESSVRLGNNFTLGTSSENQVDYAPLRLSRSKSVCGKKIAESTGEIALSPRRCMRTRSKSFSANKSVNSTNSVSVLSPMQTRSKSVCREKFISEKKSRDFKQSQSVPRSNWKSKNIQEDENNDATTENNKQVSYSSKNSSDDKAGKGSALGRSKSGVEENCKLKNLFKSVESKSVSDFICLDSSVTNHLNLSYDVNEPNKISINDSNSIDETLGNSNSESGSAISVTSYNESNYLTHQEDIDDNSLLLLQDNTYSCSICSYTTDKKSRLNDHERRHRKRKAPIFRCLYCGQRYTRYMLYLHVQSVHPGQKFQICDEELNKTNVNAVHKCTVCSFSTTDQEKLMQHIKEHPSEPAESKNDSKPPSICSICSFETINPKEFQLHIGKHTFESVECTDSFGKRIRKCGSCSYSSRRFKDLNDHLNSHKNNRPIKKCLKCDFKSTPQALLHHMRTCTKKLKSTSKPYTKFLTTNDQKGSGSGAIHVQPTILSKTKVKARMHKCEACSYTSNHFGNFSQHIYSHKKNRPIKKCLKCNFKSTPQILLHHMRICISKSQLIKLSTKDVTKNEQKGSGSGALKVKSTMSSTIEVGKRMYECEFCSYSSRNSCDLTDHKNSHKNNRPIKKCLKCDFKSTPNALFYHMRVCSGKSKRRIHKCESCSYSCNRSGDLADHINSHKNNRPIKKCLKCDFKSTPNALFHHMQICKPNIKSIKRNFKDDQKSFGSGDKRIECKMLTRIEVSKLKVQKNVRMIQPTKRIDDTGHQSWTCNVCSYGCVGFRDIHVHIAAHKRNEPINKCLNCNFKSTACALRNHMRKCQNSKSVGASKVKDRTQSKEDTIKQKSFVAVETKPKSLFKCSQCSFFTSLRIKLKLHIRKRHLKPLTVSARIFNCSRCSFSTTLRTTLKLHEQTCLAVKEIELKCKYCSFSTTLKQMYKQHLKSHTKHMPIKTCPQCSFRSTFSVLISHMQKFHSSSSIGPKVYKCSLCSFSSSKAQAYNSHIKLNHKSSRLKRSIPKFPNCDFKSTPLVSKYNEKQFMVSVENRSSDDGKIITGIESFAASSTQDNKKIESMKLSNSHREKSVFQCALCPYSASLRIKLNYHRKKYHPQINKEHTVLDERYQCNYCSYAFTRIWSLKRHIHTHLKNNLPIKQCDADNNIKYVVTNSGILACILCSYTSRYKRDIHNHTGQHSIQPTQQCFNCSYKSTPQALSVHLRKCVKPNSINDSETHGNEPGQKDTEKNEVPQDKGSSDTSPKFFKCQYCSFTSFWSYLIDRHMDSHTLLKLPIKKCEKCNFQSTPAALMAHSNACHGHALDNKSTKKTEHLKNNASTISKIDKVNTKKGYALRNSEEKCIIMLRKEQNVLSSADAFVTPEIKFKNLFVEMSANNNLIRDLTKNMSHASVKGYSDGDVSVNNETCNVSPQAVFNCSQCSFTTRLRIKLKAHLQKIHLNELKGS